MKKITLLFVAATFILTAFAQKEKMERGEEMEYKRNNRSCEIKAKFKVSKYANIVFDSYQKLVTNNANNCKSSNGTMCSFGVIAYPANNGVPAYNYPFTSFVMGDKFRTVFSGEAGSYAYYGVCAAPNLVLLPNPIYENHIWELKLIKAEDYAAATDKNYAALTGIDISTIQSIDCIKMEEPTGYTTLTETANYTLATSARGVVVYVTLKNGPQVACYPFGNQDGLGNLQWKENN
jgi:hypothetical protein